MNRTEGWNASGALEICVVAAALAVSLVVVGWPTDAAACGGFFCNQSQPVNQADENLVFSVNGDGSVTANIQIRYAGPAEEFAWLLPVYGKPDVDVSSATVFQRLTRSTNPSYNRDVTVKGECSRPAFDRAPGAGGADAAAASTDAGAEKDSAVNEIKKGSVGPYNFTVISVDKKAKDPAKQALDWLQSNGYDLTDIGPKLVRGYLKSNMNLIAFNLQKTAASGDIRPVQLTYDYPLPMIPLKLTAVAAQEDMGIRVWVAGDSRAVPTEFDGVKLNPAAINWFRWSSSYEQVVSKAADEVGGRGFVTEYAGDSQVTEDAVFRQRDERRWKELNEPQKWSDAEGELIFQTVRTYWSRLRGSQWDGMPKVVREEVPLPEDLTAREFLQNPRAVGTFDRQTEDIEKFDPASYLESLEKNVVGPVRDAEERIQDSPYLTRLFTTVSPGEMTRDPTFELKKGLPDVSNTHTAQQTIYCHKDVMRRNAPWKMELPDGSTVWGKGRNWPFDVDEINAAKRAVDYRMSGDEEVVEDNSEKIQKTIDSHNSTVDRNSTAESETDSEPASQSESACGVGLVGSGSAPAPWFAALVALGLIRLTRSRR